MKQLLFMIPALVAGTVGSFTIHPYLGVLVYYLFAILRPQFIWQWSLPDVAWSFYAGIAGLAATIAWRLGLISFEPKDDNIQSNYSHYIYYCFAIWIIISYFTSLNRDISYMYFIEYIKVFLMYAVARYAFISINQLWSLFLTIIFSLCYISYEINEIYLSTGYMYVYKRGYGGLDNNGAALMLAIGIPMCVYLWDGLQHWIRWFFILMVPAIIHAVLTSYSRGAMLSALAVTPLYFLRCKHRVQLLAFALLTVVTIPFLAGKEIRGRFSTIEQHEVDDSANQRKMAWAVAIQLANEHPLFGVGIRNANSFTYLSGSSAMVDRAIHSQWLQTAADSGYVALLLYIMLILSVLYCCHCIRSQSKGSNDPAARKTFIMANGCEGALLTFCVGASFLSLEQFELPYILLFLGAQLWAVVQASQSHITNHANY